MPPNNPLAYLSQGTGEEVDARKSAAAGLPVDAQGFKTNQMGNDIDAAGAGFLQSIFGIEPPKQIPLDVDMGPPMPTRGIDGPPAVNTGIQVSPVPRTDKFINFPREGTAGMGVQDVDLSRRGASVTPPKTPMEPGPPRQASTQPPPAQPPKVSTGTPPVTTTDAEPPIQTTAAKPVETAAPLESVLNFVSEALGGWGKLGVATTSTVFSLVNDFFRRGGAGKDATEAEIEETKKEAYNYIDSLKMGTGLYDLIEERETSKAPVTDNVPPVTPEPTNIFDPAVTARNMAQLQNMPPSPPGRAGQLAALKGQMNDTAPALPGPGTADIAPPISTVDQTAELAPPPPPLPPQAPDPNAVSPLRPEQSEELDVRRRLTDLVNAGSVEGQGPSALEVSPAQEELVNQIIEMARENSLDPQIPSLLEVLSPEAEVLLERLMTEQGLGLG